MSAILCPGGLKSRAVGTRLSLQPSSLLLPTAQVPCQAVPCRAKPCQALAARQAVPPLHTELQGCMATRGGGRGGGGGGREGREGFDSCRFYRRGEVLPFPSLPTARLNPQRGRGRGGAAVLVAAGDKCLSQPRAQDGCGCSPYPGAGGQKFLAHHPGAARGVRECRPGAREIYPGVLGSSGGSGCRGRSHLCPSSPAPPQPLTLYPGQTPSVCPSWLLPPSAVPRRTYQELVADSEPPHCRCFWGAGTVPPGSPGHRPGLMFSRAGPSLAIGA